MAAKRSVLTTIVGPQLSKQELIWQGLNPKRFYYRLAHDPDKLVTKRMRDKLAKSRGANREKIEQRLVKTAKTVEERRGNAAIHRKVIASPSTRVARQARPQEFTAHFLASVRADIANGTLIKKAGGKNRGKVSLRVRSDSATAAFENRRKRLAGEHIPDGEYQAMLDYMAHYNDPYYELLRGSPTLKVHVSSNSRLK
jgi:hypothetical protein